MNNKKSLGFWRVPDEVIAKFGPVRLVREADGQHVLVSGTAEERAAAREWCEHHAPFLKFKEQKCPRRGDFRFCRTAAAQIRRLVPTRVSSASVHSKTTPTAKIPGLDRGPGPNS